MTMLKNLRKCLNPVNSFLLGAFAGASILYSCLHKDLGLPRERDLNRDGRLDIIAREASKDQDALVFIQRPDGTYDSCRAVAINKRTYYPTLNGSGVYCLYDGFVKSEDFSDYLKRLEDRK